MKNSKKIFALLLCVALIGTILVGCSDSDTDNSNPSSEPSGTTDNNVSIVSDVNVSTGGKSNTQVDKVVVALTSASVDVSPFTTSTPGTIMKYSLYAKLFYQPYYGAPIEECIPWLAKGYTQVDEYTYDVEIFDYITDSKGNEITVDDIIWSLNMSKDVGQFADAGSFISSVEKIDDYNMRFVLATNAPNTFALLVSHGQFCIVDKDWYEGASDDEKANDPATTSAYTVSEFISGSGCTITANDNYWQTDEELNSKILPACRNVKNVVYTVITEPAMRVIALQNGEVDIADVSAADLSTFMDLSTGKSLDGWTVTVPAMIYTYCMFPNMSSNSVLGNSTELRKAVFHAIDAEQIMLATGNNSLTGKILNALAVDSYQGYQAEWDETSYWEHDVDKAKDYISEAGYEPGEVTVRLLSSTSLFTDSVRSVIISELQEAGFNVENVAVDQALFNTYKNDSGTWDLMIDVKGSKTGHIAANYSFNFAAENYSEGQGGVNFCTDQNVYDLLSALMADASDENILAFEQYLRDEAIVYGLYTSTSPIIAQSGISEIGMVASTTLVPAGCIYSDDYKSVTG